MNDYITVDMIAVIVGGHQFCIHASHGKIPKTHIFLFSQFPLSKNGNS